ncbi:MAG: hypothetical protein WBB39_03475 [Candidatus Saccharimonadales bacterium]
MKLIRWLKHHSTVLLTILVIVSIGLTVINWQLSGDLRSRMVEIVWVAPALFVTEALFVVGAIMMAVSAGENLAEYRHPRHWHRGVMTIRRQTRQFAEKLVISTLFTVGFWCNFAGAVGTSLILIIGLALIAPLTSLGVTLIIVIDLIATFGWRIPLEIARRKIKEKYVEDHRSSRSTI